MIGRTSAVVGGQARSKIANFAARIDGVSTNCQTLIYVDRSSGNYVAKNGYILVSEGDTVVCVADDKMTDNTTFPYTRIVSYPNDNNAYGTYTMYFIDNKTFILYFNEILEENSYIFYDYYS